MATTKTMGAQAKEKAIREEILNLILPVICEQYGVEPDDMFASANKLVIPVLDPEQMESYATIVVSVPRGTRAIDEDGNPYFEPYDGEGEVQAYRDHLEEQRIKHEKNAAKRNKGKATKEAKQTIKTMKQDIAEVLPSQVKDA